MPDYQEGEDQGPEVLLERQVYFESLQVLHDAELQEEMLQVTLDTPPISPCSSTRPAYRKPPAEPLIFHGYKTTLEDEAIVQRIDLYTYGKYVEGEGITNIEGYDCLRKTCLRSKQLRRFAGITFLMVMISSANLFGERMGWAFAYDMNSTKRQSFDRDASTSIANSETLELEEPGRNPLEKPPGRTSSGARDGFLHQEHLLNMSIPQITDSSSEKMQKSNFSR
jgi:hypothetical protein